MKRKVVAKVALVKDLAKLSGIPRVQASFIYDVFIDCVLKKLKDGYDVLLPNVGCIKLVPTREMESHITGQTIPPHKRIKFKANVKLARFIRVATREYKITSK